MKVAYIMSRFPLLSETFILREMIEAEKQGLEISLYPLICQSQNIIHTEVEAWLERRNCTPFMSAHVLSRNLRQFFKTPRKYLSLLWQVIYGNRSSFSFMLRGLMLFPKALVMSEKMQSEGVTHVHAHYATHPGLVAWLIHQWTGIHYSITIHSHDIYDNQSMLASKLQNAAFLAPISRYNIEFMAKEVGDWVRDKCNVIHCGIEIEKYNPKEKDSDGIFKIIHVGSLHWKKGQKYLLEALALLKERNVPFHCTMIGGGEEESALKRIIAEKDLHDVVTMLGSRTQAEVAALLPGADCYVQPSLSEGIPVAIMEAAACELPVVSTKITGIPELVVQGQTGLLVEPRNVPALANALYELWENPDHASVMGKKGRRLVEKEFTLTENVSRLIHLFNGEYNVAHSKAT